MRLGPAPGPGWISSARVIASLAMALVTACQAGAGDRPPADERSRDSTLGASQLPGAQGVRGASRAADSAASRRAREDSVGVERAP